MKNLVALLVVAFALAGTQDAMALTQFKKAFAEKYVKDHKDKEFQAAVKKASCNTCHVTKAKKNFQNEYGKLLNKLIEGDANDLYKDAKKKGKEEGKEQLEKILAQLDKAFDKVAETKSDGGKGPTYGELIKAGKLPVDPEKAIEAHKAEMAKKKSEGDDEVKDSE